MQPFPCSRFRRAQAPSGPPAKANPLLRDGGAPLAHLRLSPCGAKYRRTRWHLSVVFRLLELSRPMVPNMDLTIWPRRLGVADVLHGMAVRRRGLLPQGPIPVAKAAGAGSRAALPPARRGPPLSATSPQGRAAAITKGPPALHRNRC